MTSKFNFVVCSIEESKDIDNLLIDELQSSLLVHDQKVTKQEKEEQVLKASTENQSTFKGIEDEEDGDLKVEEAMIMAANKDTISTKRINFKEEERKE
ncbi:uncharacterized protein E5676_scaffold275G00280 [Cucumis melo var. makuwa]|uniref:Uncharacterized protein n=1 Tax=Cucumis melo var. makuwa TaxID=1194695 RepID=A0A5D3DD85_CUCMM|nr:uncharacterized protein E6C27_scaffold386G00640 [Cucumis melo var. makuwa]TYK21542.1 uncharacterized protein E5676_scaffold275G00280 [Cucumis melo var. makuwa]